MVSKLYIVDFPDSGQTLGPQVTVPHIFGLTLQQLLQLPLEVVTLEGLATKLSQSTWNCYAASGRRHLLSNCCVVGILLDTYIYLLSLFNGPVIFLLILTLNMRKLRLKEVKELDLLIRGVNGRNAGNSGPFDFVAL